MKALDKAFILTLLILDAIAIVIGMVAGPLGSVSLSLGASISAIVLSVVVIAYGFAVWKRKPR